MSKGVGASGWSLWLPRRILAGPLLLDLFHRDAAIKGRWVGFHPREFEVLWRLAESPRCSISRTQLLAEVWRLRHEPETNRVGVCVSRIRSKLGIFGVTELVVTDETGGYRLDAEVRAIPLSALDSGDALGEHEANALQQMDDEDAASRK